MTSTPGLRHTPRAATTQFGFFQQGSGVNTGCHTPRHGAAGLRCGLWTLLKARFGVPLTDGLLPVVSRGRRLGFAVPGARTTNSEPAVFARLFHVIGGCYLIQRT